MSTSAPASASASSSASRNNHIMSRNRKKSRRNFEIPRLSDLASPSPRLSHQKSYKSSRDISISTNASFSDCVNANVSHSEMGTGVRNHDHGRGHGHDLDHDHPKEITTPKLSAFEHGREVEESDEHQKRLPFSPLSNSIGNRIRQRIRMERDTWSGNNEKDMCLDGRESEGYFTPKSKSNKKKRSSFQANDSLPLSSKTKRLRQQQCRAFEEHKNTDNNMHPSRSMRDGKNTCSDLICNKNTLEYPMVLHVSSSLFKSAFRQSLKSGTHQKQLCQSGCNQLSLTDVIIPATFQAHNLQLKKMEGKALGKGHEDVVRGIRMLRCALKAAESNAICAVKEMRDEQAEKRKIERLDAKQAKIEKVRKKREQREQEKAARKAAKKEAMLALQADNKMKRRVERRKKYPKNKELWREFANLMTDLAILEREEKRWKEVNFDDANISDECESVQSKAELDAALQRVEEDGSKCSTMAQSIARDITVSANRISNVLSEVSTLMEKSDRIKDEAYEKYRKDHKFHGYRGQKDAKALVRAMILK